MIEDDIFYGFRNARPKASYMPYVHECEPAYSNGTHRCATGAAGSRALRQSTCSSLIYFFGRWAPTMETEISGGTVIRRGNEVIVSEIKGVIEIA